MEIMCRSIKVLRQPAQPATDEEISAAALQFVRKVSGTRKPAQADLAAFNTAVQDISKATARLLETMRPRRVVVRAVTAVAPAE